MRCSQGPRFILLILLAVTFGTCAPVGEMREESHSVPLGEAESAEIHIRMAVGELYLQGGAEDLLDGKFLYNVKRMKPEIDYTVSGNRGKLEIHQGKKSGFILGKKKNRWEIQLSNDIPFDLLIDFGAGKGDLDLRDLRIESLSMDMGVGDLTVDLTGDYEQDLDVKIEGGVGRVTLYLPERMGVRAHIDKGIGSLHAQGFIKSGEIYTNEAYGKSEATIHIDIDAGIGSIDLKLR